jgi:hypothetical protein
VIMTFQFAVSWCNQTTQHKCHLSMLQYVICSRKCSILLSYYVKGVTFQWQLLVAFWCI